MKLWQHALAVRHLHRQEAASALVYILVISAVIGTGVASYMGLVNAQYKSVMRSQQWNNAMPVIEAGVEEALIHLHHNDITNLALNGWLPDPSSGMFQKSHEFGGSKYVVSIRPSTPPVIISEGYVKSPLSTNWMAPRRVLVATTRQGMFTKGMVAKGQINLNGNNIRADSFDSGDPNFSTGGKYDPTKAKDGGDVATNSGLTNSLDVGNANIFGKVATGPGGSVKVGNTGAVGSQTWQSAGNKGIQSGWSSDDMNVSFPDVQLPNAIWTAPLGGTVGGVAYDMIFSTGFYKVGKLGQGGTDRYLVTGNAVLWVTNSINLTGSDALTIATNASLQLYMSGSTTDLAGKGVVNQTGNATNLYYYGTTNNTSISFGGNAAFVGGIYAPSADFKMNGSGNPSDVVDFTGSSVSKSVQMNGHYSFHYDENMGRNGPKLGWVITGWNEI